MTTNRLIHDAARLLDARIGLKPDPSFRPHLARALRDVADARNIGSESLIGALSADPSLLDQLLDRVTVQETAFFRHPEQFETLLRTLLPTIDAPVRAWSAASANGQEAYSLAMLMSEAGKSGSVLASDVSLAALRRTADGCYSEREMNGVSSERRRRHFVGGGGGWQARPALREMVVAQRHNLLDPIPRRVADCQIVMCRNVLIYFTQDHAELFLDRLADAMDPGAHLFVGGSETLWQVTDRFEPIQIGGCYVFRSRRRQAGRGADAARPAGSVATAARAPRVFASTHAGASTHSFEIARRARSSPSDGGAAAPSETESTDEARDDKEQLGLRLLASGSPLEAIVAFRQWAYLSPDDPAAHFQLGLALDDTGQGSAARRAYRAALAALDRCDPDGLVNVLKGYGRAELRQLLIDRCRAARGHDDAAEPDGSSPDREGPTVSR